MPNEPSVLIWILVTLVVALIFLFVAAVYKLWGINRELQKLTKSIDKLDGRVAEQERQLAEVKAALDQGGGGDMFAPFLAAFQQVKSKGWMAALTVLGSHLFRSYLSKRRQKSLPVRKDP